LPQRIEGLPSKIPNATSTTTHRNRFYSKRDDQENSALTPKVVGCGAGLGPQTYEEPVLADDNPVLTTER
jgi:hypothetical protein